ncbi:MAG: hypothetical protein SXA11_07880 [Cyanobacteriota bacterium]|nr:hypothetical protein [Cyanobacteriota bacterium]
MNNSFNSYYSDIEWVNLVHQLLIEIARASLSDKPKLPENIHGRAIPLAKEAKNIQERADTQQPQNPLGGNNLYWQCEELEWVEQVRQMLLELSRLSLSEIPRLPANMGQKALSLAQTAQEIKNTSAQKSW